MIVEENPTINVLFF